MTLVLLVLPGASYMFTREQLLGVREAEVETGYRLLRLIVVGTLLDAVYLAAAGPTLVPLVGGIGKDKAGFAGIVAHPRMAGLTALLLLICLPAAFAALEASLIRRRRRARYTASPTAWDAIFRDRGSCFVRVHLKGGAWAGGWFGARSAASAYPAPGDLFLESQYRLTNDGTFGPRLDDTGGIYFRAADIDVLEIYEPARKPAQDSIPGAAI